MKKLNENQLLLNIKSFRYGIWIDNDDKIVHINIEGTRFTIHLNSQQKEERHQQDAGGGSEAVPQHQKAQKGQRNQKVHRAHDDRTGRYNQAREVHLADQAGLRYQGV